MTPLALSLGTILGIHPTIRQDLTKLEISIFEQFTFLSYQAEQKGRTYITPGYEFIAGVVGCCTKTVQRATEKFEALGLVRKQRRNPLGLGQWRSNLYQVNQAVRKWARKQYRRTFMSYKQSADINYQLEEGRMPLRADSLPLTKPGRTARKALLQLGQRASPPQTE